jgi:hypothetical protein
VRGTELAQDRIQQPVFLCLEGVRVVRSVTDQNAVVTLYGTTR